jgi:hypothetical protein
MLAKHIGVEGMHTEQLKKVKKKQWAREIVDWVGHDFKNARVAVKVPAGYGGWGRKYTTVYAVEPSHDCSQTSLTS